MKLQPGSRIDRPDAGTDLPVRTQPRYGLRWQIVMLAATGLGLLSSAVAWQFTLVARPARRLLAIAAHPQLQLLVCLGALHAHHRLAVAALSLRAARALASPAGAPPVGRDLLVRAHRGHERRAAVARHDRRKAVRVVARRPAIGAPELRLGNDHLLGDRRPEPRRPLLSRVARPGIAHVTTRDKLVEAQLAALQQQLHPHFLFNTLHAISALMHKDVEAADRTLMDLGDLLRLSLDSTGNHEVSLKMELEFLRSTSASSRPGSPIASRCGSTSSRKRWTRECRT